MPLTKVKKSVIKPDTFDDRYYTQPQVDALLAGISGSLDDHNEANNIQGGIIDQYYHLTSQEYTDLQFLETHEIITSSGSLSSASTDTQLATAKLIYNTMSTISGVIGDATPTYMYYADSNGNISSTSHMTYDDNNGIYLEHSAGNDYITIEEDAITIDTNAEMYLNIAGGDMLYADGTDLYLTSDGTVKLDLNSSSSTITLEIDSTDKLTLDGSSDTFTVRLNNANIFALDTSEFGWTASNGQIYIGGTPNQVDLYAGEGGGSTGLHADKDAYDRVQLRVNNTSELEVTSDLIEFYGNTFSGTGDIYCNDIFTSSGTVHIGTAVLSSTPAGDLLINGSGLPGAVTGTPDNIFYAGAGGEITDTSDMTYDPDTGNITLGDSTDTRLFIDQNGYIYGYSNNQWRFMIGENEQSVGLSGTNDVLIRTNIPDILFNISDTTEMSIDANGMSLKTGADVNEILDSGDTLNASSTDDQLATAKLIYTTLSGLEIIGGGTPTYMYYVDDNGDIAETDGITYDYDVTSHAGYNLIGSGLLTVNSGTAMYHPYLSQAFIYDDNGTNKGWSELGNSGDYNGTTWLAVSSDLSNSSNDQVYLVSNNYSTIVDNSGILFQSAYGVSELQITTDGMKLKNGTATVNEIINVADADSIDASSTDDQLATAKLIYATISGTIVDGALTGGTPTYMYYADGSGNITSTQYITFDSAESLITVGEAPTKGAYTGIQVDFDDDHINIRANSGGLGYASIAMNGDTGDGEIYIDSRSGAEQITLINGSVNIVAENDVKMSATASGVEFNSNYFTYFGDSTVSGSWRMGISGEDFIHQKYNGSIWETKQTIVG